MANNIDININAQELVNAISQAVQEIGGKVAGSTLELLEKSSPMIVKTLEEGVKSDYIYYQTEFVANTVWVIVLPIVVLVSIIVSLHCVKESTNRVGKSENQQQFDDGISIVVVGVSVLLCIISFFSFLTCQGKVVSNYKRLKQIETAPTYFAAQKAMELVSEIKANLTN
jgi:amino acid transporter